MICKINVRKFPAENTSRIFGINSPSEPKLTYKFMFCKLMDVILWIEAFIDRNISVKTDVCRLNLLSFRTDISSTISDGSLKYVSIS